MDKEIMLEKERLGITSPSVEFVKANKGICKDMFVDKNECKKCSNKIYGESPIGSTCQTCLKKMVKKVLVKD